jgi:cytochrome c556
MRSVLKPKMFQFGITTLCALACLAPAYAEDATAAQKAVELRQSVLKLIGWNFSPTIGPMMADKMKYDPAVVQKDAARLEALAPMLPDAFQMDTHAVSGLKTKARAGIWTNMADFKSKDDDLIKAVAHLSAVARNGDEDAFKQAAKAVSQACRACHDNYRED